MLQWERILHGSSCLVKIGPASIRETKGRTSFQQRRSHHEGRNKKGQYPRHGGAYKIFDSLFAYLPTVVNHFFSRIIVTNIIFFLQPEVHSQSTASAERDAFKMAEEIDNDISAELAADPDTVALNEINVFQVSIYIALFEMHFDIYVSKTECFLPSLPPPNHQSTSISYLYYLL